MEMSDKIAVRNLVEICVSKGLKHVVVSPGSRNAPLSISFGRHPEIKTTTIVDERSAAFYAVGIAQQTGAPVAIVCTSGTAALNYAPAIAEAYYQKLPLLVLTADRPKEWIDQMDGQTIRQENIFSNYIKKSFCFPTEPENEAEIWHASRISSEAIESTLFPEAGPVHINLPFREPLYNLRDYSNEAAPNGFSTIDTKLELSQNEIDQLKADWSSTKKILIVGGLMHPNPVVSDALQKIAKQENVAVLTETTSNLHGEDFNRSIDRLIAGIEGQAPEDFQPELLITLGGPIVSKKIKAFLRKYQPNQHWHINASNDYIDTFQSLSKIVPISPEKFLPHFENVGCESDYNSKWKSLDDKLLQVFKDFLSKVEFCDLKVFETVLNLIPEKSNLQLANSTAVRYSNLFDTVSKKQLNCFSNRGTSGIDGTISTAVGAASTTDKLTTVITGDLSFFYDSNALWIKPMPSNLKIFVVNNSGGNIFRIIDGPSKLPELENYFEAKHDLNAEGIASTFGIPYIQVTNDEQLNEATKKAYSTEGVEIIEIKTSNTLTPDTLMEYFRALKNS